VFFFTSIFVPFLHYTVLHSSLPYLNFHSSAISIPNSLTSAHIHALIYITSESPPPHPTPQEIHIFRIDVFIPPLTFSP
jgi:hypothetical protein